jgi:hypothetical protein
MSQTGRKGRGKERNEAETGKRKIGKIEERTGEAGNLRK